MALSEYEKQVLAEMEQHLRQQDPELADAMAKAAPAKPEAPAPSKPLSVRRIALGSILAAAGLGIVLVGVSMGFSFSTVVLGALGFLMMVGGVLYALSTDDPFGKGKDKKDKGKKPASPPKVNSGATPSKSTSSRQEERRKRWEQRGS